MPYERISKKAVVLWELVAAVAAALLILLAVILLRPGTWLWYTVLWVLGAAWVLVAFLYLPLLYLSMGFSVGEEVIAYRAGLIFPKTELLYRDRTAFVTVYTNPLTPVLHISSLVISAAGGSLRLHFIDSERAGELAELLRRERKAI